jgi:hypothetical protein
MPLGAIERDHRRFTADGGLSQQGDTPNDSGGNKACHPLAPNDAHLAILTPKFDVG